MFRSGHEVVEWINSQLKFGMRPGLERMEAALLRLSNPHEQIKTIHIAGTNGKGSTVTYLSSILQSAGYQVGTFTSPYIEYFNERICINNEMISDDDLAWCANVIKPIVEDINKTEMGPFTEFEIITLLSFVYFKNHEVDVVIYEVGLGGRLDATNVIKPLVCGITNIGHDHQAILGDTLESIALEKLGIVKSGVPLFSSVEEPKLLDLFKSYCADLGSSFVPALELYPVSNVQMTTELMTFDWPDLTGIELSMKGQHQIKNATLAYSIINFLKEKRIFNVSDVCLYRGIKEAYWKGRFEVLNDYPPVIIDGAHNQEGMKELCETVQSLYPHHQKHFVVSILGDKDCDEMFGMIREVADKVYFTTFDFHRAQSAESLFLSYGDNSAAYHENFEVVLEHLLSEIEDNDCLIITGSLYFISSVRKFLIN
ncbi:MAG TPA: bifunctional folylpolyglutamate synthase/dihydrofolate synthase [Firmicutes bacterium]|nr:bifunctional folylpolyglutamate synthase/dihydrofolate synthase [Bacillota bacterium]